MKQDNSKVAVPERYRDNYDDFEELQADKTTTSALKNLRNKSRESGKEYAVVVQNGKASEVFTSGAEDSVGVSLDNYRGSVEVYHSHTNVTPPSAKDFAILLNPKVEKFGNIAYNSDAFIVSVGGGWIPSVEEYNEAVKDIAREVNRDMINDPDFMSWTIPERNYAAIREQAYRIARYFGWTIEGGKIDE